MASRAFIIDLIVAQWASVIAVPQAAIMWARARITEAKWHHSDLLRLVILGDSLSAGAQPDTTEPDLYVCGFAALLAAQARVELSYPQIISNTPTCIESSTPPRILPNAVQARRKFTRSQPISVAYNLAVVGSKIEDAVADLAVAGEGHAATAPSQPTNFETCNVQSQIVWAEKLAPSTIIIWLGTNDVLTALLGGDCSLLTPLNRFTAAYNGAVRRAAATGAKLVIGNIPDVTCLPYLIPANEVAALTARSLAELESSLGVTPNDFIMRQSFDLIAEALSRHRTDPLPRYVKLTSSQVEKIRNTVRAYNQVIESGAKNYDAALVDVYSLTNKIFRHGLKVGRRLLTTDFLGGIFSLAGIHPSNTGYAIIANEFIRTINDHFGSCIPPVNLDKIISCDPLLSSRCIRTGPEAASTNDKEEQASSGFSSLVEGQDYYREGSAVVFTAQYHLRRGYCCQNCCRHCPFKEALNKAPQP